MSYSCQFLGVYVALSITVVCLLIVGGEASAFPGHIPGEKSTIRRRPSQAPIPDNGSSSWHNGFLHLSEISLTGTTDKINLLLFKRHLERPNVTQS